MPITILACLRRPLLLLILPCAAATAADCKKNPDRWLDEQCLQQSVERTSVEVERTTSDLVASADDIRRLLLTNGHKAWQVHRDQQCKLEFDTTRAMHQRYPQHGTMAPLAEQRCRLRLNDYRLLELKDLAKRSSDRFP